MLFVGALIAAEWTVLNAAAGFVHDVWPAALYQYFFPEDLSTVTCQTPDDIEAVLPMLFASRTWPLVLFLRSFAFPALPVVRARAACAKSKWLPGCFTFVGTLGCFLGSVALSLEESEESVDIDVAFRFFFGLWLPDSAPASVEVPSPISLLVAAFNTLASSLLTARTAVIALVSC